MLGMSARRLTIALGLLAIGGAAVLALLAAGGAVPATTAAWLAAAGAAFAALGVIVIGVRRVDNKVQKVLREHRRHADVAGAAAEPLTELGGRAEAVLGEVRDVVRDLQGALGEDRVETLTALAEVRRHLDRGLAGLSDQVRPPIAELEAAVRRLDGTVEPLPERVERLDKRVRGVDDAVTGLPDRLRRPIEANARETYELIEAYVDLRQLIRPRAPLPGLSGWAASPRALRAVLEAVWRGRAELVVECGSGSSSVWLGYAVEQLGAGRVVALEHDERYLALSADLVRAHGLEDVVEVRHAPLEPWRSGEETYSWYDTAKLADLNGIGVLFVDGPPGPIGPQARYPALPVLLPRCAPEVVIVLDDAERSDERLLSDRWLAEHPELERATRGKRVHLFTRRAS
jgi:predicted O-methyltransferase YrrM